MLLTWATTAAQVGRMDRINGGPVGLPTGISRISNATPGNNGFNNQNDMQQSDTASQEIKGIEHHEDIPDSVLIGSVFRFHFTPLAVKILKLENPNFEPTGAQQYDRLHSLNGNYYLSTGVIGQSHTATFYDFDDNLTLRLMPNTQQGYSKTPNTVNFYQVQRPYTVLGYGGSIDKDNLVHVSHTQNINERWNVSLDYDLIRAEGIYANSGTKNHYLDITSNYYSKDARYQVQGGILFQKYLLNENGGMVNDSIFSTNPSANIPGIPVVSYDATSTTKDFTIFAHQSWNNVRQVQHIRPISTLIIDTIRTLDTLGAETLSFTQRDSIIGYDTLQPHKPHVFNAGVFGLDLEYDRFARKYIDSVRFNQFSYNLYWTNDAYPDYRWHNPFKLTLGFKGSRAESCIAKNNWHTPFQFGPYVHTEIHPFYGTIDLHAELTGYADLRRSDMVPSDMGEKLTAQYTAPIDSTQHITLLAQQIYRPSYYIYQGNTNTSWFKYSLTYLRDSLLYLELSATDAQHLAYLTRDSLGLKAQTTSQIWLFQARAGLSLKLGWFHYDMQQLLQYSSNKTELPLPLWTSKNSIYADINLFKGALRAQVGIDVRYLTSYYAEAYDPISGLFYRQSNREIGNCVWGDIFVNLQVKRATIYAKVGHINSLFEQHPNYFLLPHYADTRLGVFYGVTWKFFD